MWRTGETTLMDVDDARVQSSRKQTETSQDRGACSLPTWQRYGYRPDEQGRWHLPRAPVVHGKVSVGAASGWLVTVWRG